MLTLVMQPTGSVIPVQPSSVEMRKAVFFSIAQDNYPGPNSLPVVRNDVRCVTAAFTEKFGERLVVAEPIRNVGTAEMHTITAKLQEEAQRQHLRDGDLVILYVGGHGMSAGGGTVLAPIDFRPDNQLGVIHGRVKEFLDVFQGLNPGGVNHIVWNLCREPLQGLNLPNLAIAGSNYHILYACPDTRLSYVGDSQVELNGNRVQVSNFAKAYANAVRWQPTLHSVVVETRNELMQKDPPQVCQTLEALVTQQVSFGLLDAVGGWLWENVVAPGAAAAAHAGLNAAEGLATNLVEQGRGWVNSTFALHGPGGQELQNGTYIIQVAGGTNQGKKFLSCTADGKKVDLYHMIDNSGRQKWTYTRKDGFGILRAAGGIDGDRVWLSCTDDGEKVDLYHHDDASGRQRWTIEECADGISRKIKVYSGVTGDRKYLSCTPCGKVDLWDKDDESGRQRWIFMLAE